MLTGLNALKERMAAIEKARQHMSANDRELKLKDSEIARIRFITDGDDFYTDSFHSVPRKTPSGKDFSEDVLCTAQERECSFCESLEEALCKTKIKIFTWVYVYYILHRSEVENSSIFERAGLKFFKQDINDFKIIKTGEGWGGYIANKFISYFNKYGTLLDRDYEWIRQGASLNTTYELLPEDPLKVAASITKAAASLPLLKDHVTGGETGLSDNSIETGESEPAELPLLERLKREREAKGES